MFTYTAPRFPYVYPSTRVPKASSEWNALFALDDRDMNKFLLDIFRYAELSSGRVQFDEMMEFGNALCAVGKQYSDAMAISWLSQNPTARRLEITSAFLAGFWEANGHDEAISLEGVEAFMRLRHRIISSDESAYNSVFALSKLLSRAIPASLKERIIATLQSAAQDRYEQKTTEEIATALIRKMLAAIS
jgi:hypothetical protein